MKKKIKKGRMLNKVKKSTIVLTVVFMAGGIFLNSKYVSNRQDEVYAQMKEKYGIVVQKEPDTIEESSNTAIKNFALTVDSDLRIPSNVTAEEINLMLEGTRLYGLGEAFVQAEQKYGVNALYMMGLACEESGFGTSAFALKRNNLYGWNAVDSNPDKATYFNSKEEATMFVASKLKANYLTEGGAYHEGFSARSVDLHYCTDKRHADKIVKIVSDLLKKLG